MNSAQFQKSQYRPDLAEVLGTVDALRRNPDNPRDISLGDFVKKKWGISMESFYTDLGISPATDTISNMVTLPDMGAQRFLVPEIIRDALRLGLRKSPIWNNIIAAEQTIKQPSITIPWINMSEATPRKVATAEDMTVGNVSFGSKSLKISKIGRGIKLPYEVMQYVSISIISLFLQDFGVKLNQGIDAMAIDCLINGEQADGSESAPVIGVATTNTLAYADLLKIWIRMSRMGRLPGVMIGGEASALKTLNLDEFKKLQQGTTEKKLNLKTPIPTQSDYYIHGSMDPDQTLIIDTSSALIKYNAQPLLIESDKFIRNQTVETYASLTTGFGILYRDARIVLDSSIAFAGNGFPTYMDVDPLEQVNIV